MLHPAEIGELNKRLDDIRELVVKLRPQEEWLTTQQVAKRYKVHRKTVLLWASCGLPRYEAGKSFLFKMSDVENFLENFRRQEHFDLNLIPARKSA